MLHTKVKLTRQRTRTSGNAPYRQAGGIAIEFALAFPIFFVLFYAIVSYSLIMTLEQSLTHASLEGARAAVRIDRTAFTDNAAYQAKVTETARSAVVQTLTWLPSSQKEVILGSPPGFGNVGVEFAADRITVTLNYPYNQAPILPVLALPVVGSVPRVPNNFAITAYSLL